MSNKCVIYQKIMEDEQEGRCYHPTEHVLRQAIYRKKKESKLMRTYPGLYARNDYWEKLYPVERMRHIALPLMDLHPEWKFTSLTAAAMLGYQVVTRNLRMHSHPDCTPIYIRSKFYPSKRVHKQLFQIATKGKIPDGTEDDVRIEQQYHGNMRSLEHLSDAVDYAIRSHIVDKSTMLFDTANTVPFASALAVFDSAARDNVDFSKVLEICEHRYRNGMNQNNFAINAGYSNYVNELLFDTVDNQFVRLRRLCELADKKSENGGESFARAQMIELGFMIPELQHEFVIPGAGKSYRTDFLWKLPSGALIVGELDGHGKYLVDCDDPKHNRLNFNNSADNLTLQSSVDWHVINRNIDHQVDRTTLLRERCGVTRIVRFVYSDVIDVRKFEQKLLKAGVPRIAHRVL